MEVGKLFVGGLHAETCKESLKRHFSSYGEVTDCVVMATYEGKSRGFGFVTFADPDAVTAVLANQVHKIDGKVVDPKPCSARGTNNGPSKGGHRPHFTGKTTKVFIGGLPNDASEESLRSFFSSYGKVVDVVIMKDQATQKQRGFGFLTFDSEDAVDKASDDHFVNFNGKQVEVKKAEPRQGGGGGGGGRRQMYNQEQQGWGDGWNQNQGGYGYQQSSNSYGGYGNQGFDQSWGQSQNYNQGWQGQGGYGNQGYSQQQPQQQQYGGQSYGGQGYSNGQSYGGSNYNSGAYGGYGAQGYNNSYNSGQGYGGSQGSSGNQGGYGGAQGYGGGSTDGYGGSSGGGKSSSGGGSQAYHPYKR